MSTAVIRQTLQDLQSQMEENATELREDLAEQKALLTEIKDLLAGE